MPAYDFECETCGAFELALAMSDAAAEADCPACGRRAARVFSAPMLTAPGSPVRRAREFAERSAHEPIVAARPPSATAVRRRAANPLHAKLPRP